MAHPGNKVRSGFFKLVVFLVGIPKWFSKVVYLLSSENQISDGYIITSFIDVDYIIWLKLGNKFGH